MSDTPFARLAGLGQQLEETSKRLELAALLADFLRALSPDEISSQAVDGGEIVRNTPG